MYISTNLVFLRKRRGHNQNQVASNLGISQGTLSLWERGIVNPPYEKLKQLSMYYGVSFCDIIDCDLSE